LLFTERGTAGLDFVRRYSLTNPAEIKVAAGDGISVLQNDDSLTGYDAQIIWQYSQCLKKFRYGDTVDAEMQKRGWIERNAACADRRLPWWVADEVRKLLKPLDEEYARWEGEGRFGNGNVEEGLNVFRRWGKIHQFWYDYHDPECVAMYEPSSPAHARLAAVPKDMFKDRLITVEPMQQSFLQQWCRDRLLRAVQVLPTSSAIPQQLYGRGPEVQQFRCARGSCEGSLATIDLSDASDSISVYDVLDVFPPLIAADLEKSRSEYVDVDGTHYRTHMYAGMGNATTFVVETLFFWAVVTSIARRLRDYTPVSVFGDDIVCGIRTARHPLFNEWMAACGLKLNWDKCGVSSGPGFREACGIVAFRGDVLPLKRISGYREENPAELERLCTLCNDVYDRSDVLCSLKVLLWDVGRDLSARRKIPRVPAQLASNGLYIVDPLADHSTCRSRWCTSLQRTEYRVRHVVKPVIRRDVRDLTRSEAEGVYRGQLRTAFADAPLGFHSKRTEILFPSLDGRTDVRNDWLPRMYAERKREPESLWDLA
jgi:hypothetical protein